MSGTAASDFAGLCAAAREVLGLRLEGYRRRQLERRLEFFRQRHGLHSLGELARRLAADPDLRQQFADFITINVSEFFRNPQRFTDLRERHLARLLQARPALRVWSAGCSIGAELYSVALLLRELAPDNPHQLLGTDIDERSLQRAAAGVYRPQEVREVPAPLRQRYLRQTPAGWEVSPALRQGVAFRRHDLLADPFPQEQDLIICRNVVIYLTAEARDQLYRQFRDSLRPGGLLFIGAAESIVNARAFGLRYLGPCFYEKPAHG